MTARWHFWIDRGGTFTDVVAREPDGALGAARIERVDGSVERLGSTVGVDIRAGDVFVIDTPGGGGFGDA